MIKPAYTSTGICEVEGREFVSKTGLALQPLIQGQFESPKAMS